MRLQKFLARAGVASRRGSENLMTEGRVRVNGEVVKELGSRVDPLIDKIAVDGKIIPYPNDAVTLMLNKPAGFITTMSDPYGRPCVASLIPVKEYPGLFPIGRLDADTTGLLLFSTDGELGNRLMHPRHQVEKTYEAQVEGCVNEGELDRLRKGVVLEDGLTLPAKAQLISGDKNSSSVRLCIREGRKRQVRRMLEEIGHPVLELRRTQIASLELGDIKEGAWRFLDKQELSALEHGMSS